MKEKRVKPKYDKIPFRNFLVYVISDETGGVDYVNLHDLCKILKRKEMIENGTATDLCSSATRFPMYGNGKLYWFISVYDIHILLNSIRKENKTIAKLCDELEEWTAALPVGKSVVMLPDKTSSKEKQSPENPVTLYFRDKPVFFKAENGKYYFNATRMAGVYGKNPREWLLLSGTTRFREALVKEGISESLESQIITKRGSQGETWLEVNVAVELARWLSPEFSVWCNEQIVELGIEGVVVLNKDKKKQSYPTNEPPKEFPVPTNFKEALLLAAAQQEEIDRQREVIEENRHKVAFYDEFIENRDWFKSTTLADELKITPVKLNKFLVENRICSWDRSRKQYVTNGSHATLQIEVPYLWTNKKGKTYAFGKVKRWSKAGREYIIELWHQHNPQIINP